MAYLERTGCNTFIVCFPFLFFLFKPVFIWFLKSNKNSNKGKVNRTDLPLSLGLKDRGFLQYHWSLNASCSRWRGYMKVSHRCCTKLKTSALLWHLQPFKTHPKIVIWGPGMVLTKSGLLCRIHLVVKWLQLWQQWWKWNRSKHKKVAELSLSVENAPIFPELMLPVPRLVSFAADCYMGAVCKSDSGSISYGSSISLEGFLDCTDSKNYYYRGDWAEERRNEKEKILYIVHSAAFAVPKVTNLLRISL